MVSSSRDDCTRGCIVVISYDMMTRCHDQLTSAHFRVIIAVITYSLCNYNCSCNLTVHTGNYNRRFRQQLLNSVTVAENGDCRRIRPLSPFMETVAVFGHSHQIRRMLPNSATIFAVCSDIGDALHSLFLSDDLNKTHSFMSKS